MSLTPEFNVHLYGRPGCCLCEEAAGFLRQLEAEYLFRLEHVNIDDDPILQARYCCQIPVVTIDGGNRVALRVTLPRLRRAFQRAARRAASDAAAG